MAYPYPSDAPASDLLTPGHDIGHSAWRGKPSSADPWLLFIIMACVFACLFRGAFDFLVDGVNVLGGLL